MSQRQTRTKYICDHAGMPGCIGAKCIHGKPHHPIGVFVNRQVRECHDINEKGTCSRVGHKDLECIPYMTQKYKKPTIKKAKKQRVLFWVDKEK